jgi:hypothetical protein
MHVLNRSGALEPQEREAVRGDFAESGESGGQALRDLLGLIIRRHAALWKDPGPWVTLLGLVVPLGMMLSLVSRRVPGLSAIYAWLYVNNGVAGYLAAGFRQDLVHTAAGFAFTYLTLILRGMEWWIGAWISVAPGYRDQWIVISSRTSVGNAPDSGTRFRAQRAGLFANVLPRGTAVPCAGCARPDSRICRTAPRPWACLRRAVDGA